MTYLELYEKASRMLDNNEITLGEYEEMIKPLEAEVERWIPCSEKMPEENNWLGGSRRQFSDEVLVSVVNYDDDEILTHISQTIEGKWALNFASRCKVIAWMSLPKPYEEGVEADETD